MNLWLCSKNDSKPPVSSELRFAILVTLTLCSIYTSEAVINTDRILGCYPREYKFNASKTTEVNGELLSCWDIVRVYSCWGRCDSYEFGTYKIPYTIRYHPVCTYTGVKTRKVRLRVCHPSFPDPYYEVFDASGCSCKLCESRNTSCEYLNG